MNRRKFLITTGTAVLTSSTIHGISQPAIAVEFEISAVQDSEPNELDTIHTEFTNFTITPRYLNVSDNIDIQTTMNIENGARQISKTAENIPFTNGESLTTSKIKNRTGTDISTIHIDELNQTDSPIDGYVEITVDHSDITETYKQTFSINSPNIIDATGGTTVKDVTINDTKYRIHAFEATGTNTFEVNTAPSERTVDVLLVGGGGGGGENDGGGGGAGGLIYESDLNISEGTHDITVGDGGVGAQQGSTGYGDSGEDTTAFGLTAIGGGGGGPQTKVAKDGGSGGGGGHPDSSGGTALQPSSTDGGFGHNGGSGQYSNEPYPGGGGGGASEIGDSPSSSSERGHGGDGKDYSHIFTSDFGENGWFAGGGGGGSQHTPRANGGTGGGGSGGVADGDSDNEGVVYNAQDGQDNTGGGAGATGEGGYQNAGKGGSGVVLIRYIID